MEGIETVSVSAGRWDEIMAEALTSSQLLADRFLTQVADVPGYAFGEIDDADLHETARRSFEQIIGSLRSEHITPELSSLAMTVASSRARRGVPAESVARAARLDFSILWAHLLEICGPQDAPLLATRVERVWRVIDEYVTAIGTAYADELVRLARSERAYRREFISRLFGNTGHSLEVMSAVAAALKLDADAQYTLVAATEPQAEELLAAIAGGPRAHDVYLYEHDGMTFAFWQATRADASGRQMPLRDPGIARVVCGVIADLTGLGAVAPAVSTVASLARAATPADGGPLSMDHGWARLAREKVREAGLDLVVDMNRRLSALRDGERERIEETVRAFLECGSVNVTATKLYCHRNTILNRLNRFTEVTGINLVVPTESARLVVGWY